MGMNIDEYNTTLSNPDVDTASNDSSNNNASVETAEKANTPLVEKEISDETKAVVDKLEVEASTNPEYLDIDGEKVSLDELRKGYLRQSDYTRKTQSLAQQRKDTQKAIELYEHINSNPELSEVLRNYDTYKNDALQKTDPVLVEVEKLKQLQEEIALEREITRLSRKYSDFDEVAVLNEASRRNVTDLEFIYNAIKSTNQKSKGVDIEALKEEIRKELLNEMQSKDVGTTIIGSKGVAPGEKKEEVTLSNSEAKIAEAFGLTKEEYLEHKKTTR